MLKAVKAKKYQLSGKKCLIKRSKFHKNGRFDFWTSWPKINCNPLSSLQSCTSSSKYLFYFVLWDLFSKFIRVFGGIWQYNVEISNTKLNSMISQDSVPLKLE